jgi:hypothetical protein
MNRKERRAVKKYMGKDATEQLAQKVFLFDKLPESCSACEKEFDKRDHEMVLSWKVVVRQETVRIFCPDCTKKTKEILDEYR